MRLNQFIARATGLSRRRADELIKTGLVQVNGAHASYTDQISESDKVRLNSKLIKPKPQLTILFNKPTGYVTSRTKQGNAPTIYNLLPLKFHHLKPVGRLDKESCGLLLLTNDGHLAERLTHPKYQKLKVYSVRLNKSLTANDFAKINKGIKLIDGTSHLNVTQYNDNWLVSLKEGKNRQIRRTFSSLDYKVTYLERLQFGDYKLGKIPIGSYELINKVK